jgi:transitional endoplasmic reticulum ATPase
LTEIDGISALRDVVVLAATNRPDIVDPAVLRPGRFDRLIYVSEPNEVGRMQIFKIHSTGIPLAKDVNLQEMTHATKGYSGADIKSVCREAAMIALRRDISSNEVTPADFQEALQKINPSISPDMENWYKSFMKQVRKLQKPAPLVV